MDGFAGLSAGAREGEAPWIVEHPKFKEMMMLDVADRAQVYAACLVYMDLLEVRNWMNVQILSSSELQTIYLCGKERDDGIPQVIIPIPVAVPCSHERIQQFVQLSRTSKEDTSAACSVLLAIVENDSTIVYYKLTDGFVIPDPPDFVEDMVNKCWRKKKMRFLH
ncbi:endonuclease subunit, partial [Pristimantis euphronides]